MIGFKHLIGRSITCFGAQIDTLIALDAIILYTGLVFIPYLGHGRFEPRSLDFVRSNEEGLCLKPVKLDLMRVGGPEHALFTSAFASFILTSELLLFYENLKGLLNALPKVLSHRFGFRFLKLTHPF